MARVADPVLREVPMFADCSARELRVAWRRETVDAGAVVVHEGDPATEFFVGAAGQAAVERRRRHVATLQRGDFFGEIALVADGARTATVRAITPMTLAVLDKPAFDQLLDDSPRLAARILKGALHRMLPIDAA